MQTIILNSAININLYSSGYSPVVINLPTGEILEIEQRFDDEIGALQFASAIAINQYVADSTKSEIIWRWKGGRIVETTSPIKKVLPDLVGSRLFNFCADRSTWNCHKRDLISNGRDAQIMQSSIGTHLMATRWCASVFGGLAISEMILL